MNRWFIANTAISIVLALLAFGLISTGVMELILGKSITTNLVLPLVQIALGVWLAIEAAKTAHAKSGKVSFPEPRKSS